MSVVAATLFFAFQPLAGRFVEVFADVGLAIVVLGMNVIEKSIEVVAGVDEFLGIVAEHICQCDESLGSSERPDCAVPFTFAAAMRTEFRMTAFSGGDAEGRAKPL